MHMVMNICSYVAQVLGSIQQAHELEFDEQGPQVLVPEIVASINAIT